MVNTFTPAVQDFDVAVALGVIRNTNGNAYSSLINYGLNRNVTQNTIGVWERGTPFIFTEEPQFIRIKAGGSANDTDGGSGAHDVIVIGLGESFDIETERLVAAGVNESPQSTKKFWRPFGAFCDRCGSYGGGNADEVVIENEDGDDVLVIAANQSFSNFGSFSVPGNHTAVIRDLDINVGKRDCNIELFVRPRFDLASTPFGVAQAFRKFDEVPPGSHPVIRRPVAIPEKTDIYINAMSSSGGPASVSISMDILLVPNK